MDEAANKTQQNRTVSKLLATAFFLAIGFGSLAVFSAAVIVSLFAPLMLAAPNATAKNGALLVALLCLLWAAVAPGVFFAMKLAISTMDAPTPRKLVLSGVLASLGVAAGLFVLWLDKSLPWQ